LNHNLDGFQESILLEKKRFNAHNKRWARATVDM
jgi:hypothetical protein